MSVVKPDGIVKLKPWLVSRPDAIVTTTGGSSTNRLRADAVEVQAGAPVRLWKDHCSR